MLKQKNGYFSLGNYHHYAINTASADFESALETLYQNRLDIPEEEMSSAQENAYGDPNTEIKEPRMTPQHETKRSMEEEQQNPHFSLKDQIHFLTQLIYDDAVQSHLDSCEP